MYQAPRDPYQYLKTAVGYNFDECYSGRYNHSIEEFKEDSLRVIVPCTNLLNRFPFVTHVRGAGGSWCMEILSKGGEILNTYVRSAVGIPVC